MNNDTSTVPEHGFDHPAFFYRSADDYLNQLVPFVAEGLRRRQSVCVAVPEPNLRLLRGALDAAADQVHMVDMTEAGRNPGRIIAGVLSAFADSHPDERVRIIGEPVWPGRTAAEYPACVQHEALINTAFAGRDLTIVCPYDAARLDERVLADAYATHPVLWDDGEYRASPSFAPACVHARYNQPLTNAGGEPTFLVTTADDVAKARRFAAEEATRLGLSENRCMDMELIATELTTNSLRYTDEGCELRIRRDGGHVVCDVRDTGELVDPLAGRRPAVSGAPSGRGLLLVHELADLVRTHTGPHGTAIQTYLRLDGR